MRPIAAGPSPAAQAAPVASRPPHAPAARSARESPLLAVDLAVCGRGSRAARSTKEQLPSARPWPHPQLPSRVPATNAPPQSLEANTQANYRRVVPLYFTAFFGNTALSEVDRARAYEWREWMVKQTVGRARLESQGGVPTDNRMLKIGQGH